MGTNLPVNPLTAGDTFSFSGTRVDNVAVAAAPFAVTNATTIQDLLNAIELAFGVGGTEAGVKAVLDKDGNIRVIDETHGGKLVAKMGFHDPGVPVTTKNPFGLVDEAADATLTPNDSVTGDINITTAKRMVLSTGRAFNSATGDISPILSTTQWSSVYDDNKDPLINAGLPRGVANGDSITFTGKKGDGTDVTKTFTIEFVKDGKPGTVQDLLTALETAFDCTAQIDTAGRLVLTDRAADTVAVQSKLSIDSITYAYDPLNPGTPDIFGSKADFIPADIASEDGSQQGDIITTTFASEALSTTQYAATSTTIFQDQDGFASGFLHSVSTDNNGVITGHYSNGQVVELGQCACCDGN
jgi:flagellar hook protein FlgE